MPPACTVLSPRAHQGARTAERTHSTKQESQQGGSLSTHHDTNTQTQDTEHRTRETPTQPDEATADTNSGARKKIANKKIDRVLMQQGRRKHSWSWPEMPEPREEGAPTTHVKLSRKHQAKTQHRSRIRAFTTAGSSRISSRIDPPRGDRRDCLPIVIFPT